MLKLLTDPEIPIFDFYRISEFCKTREFSLNCMPLPGVNTRFICSFAAKIFKFATLSFDFSGYLDCIAILISDSIVNSTYDSSDE